MRSLISPLHKADHLGRDRPSPIPRPLPGFAGERVPRPRAVPAPPYFKPIRVNTRSIEEELRRYLDQHEPKLARILYSTWNAQAEAIKYQEIRNAIRDGEIPPHVLERWQQDYARLVANELDAWWKRALLAGLDQSVASLRKRVDRNFWLPPSSPAAQRMLRWVERHGAELAANLSEAQREALKQIIRREVAAGTDPDELARFLRAVIGFTPKEALAIASYRDNLLRQGLSEREVLHKVGNYAGFLHRRRASRIARTELAYAYNFGQLEGMRSAIERGLATKIYKVFLTAHDERVCPFCGPLDGTVVDLEDTFPGATARVANTLAPPLHPNCRCTLLWRLDPTSRTSPPGPSGWRRAFAQALGVER